MRHYQDMNTRNNKINTLTKQLVSRALCSTKPTRTVMSVCSLELSKQGNNLLYSLNFSLELSTACWLPSSMAELQ
jgi:hypothetical protein